MTDTTVQQVAAAALAHSPLRAAHGRSAGQGYIGQALGYADVLATAFTHGMNLAGRAGVGGA